MKTGKPPTAGDVPDIGDMRRMKSFVSPVCRTYSTEITHFRVATSRFIAYQALLFYYIFGKKARVFSNFYGHMCRNFALSLTLFLCILHKNAPKIGFFNRFAPQAE
jgi:hypothetical protein